MQSIKGTVETVYFNSATWTSGALLRNDGKKVKFTVNSNIDTNAPVVLHGEWFNDPKYGLQFKAVSFTLDTEITGEGLANYLSNHPAFKGIGPSKAKKISEAFGKDWEAVLMKEPQKIADAVNVKLDTVLEIQKVWTENKEVNDAILWLAGFGLTNFQIGKIVETYKSNTIPTLKINPYLISRMIKGFGFKKIDGIAQKMGIDTKSPYRIEAAVREVLHKSMDDGHCWLYHHEIVKNVHDLAGNFLSSDSINDSINELIKQDELAVTKLGANDTEKISFKFVVEKEKFILNMLNSNEVFDSVDTGEIAEGLNEKQVKALNNAIKYKYSLISGGAGSGKTFTAARIYELFKREKLHTVVCAPTGKAAKRLSLKIGTDAFTIHRLLGYNGTEFTKDVVADAIIIDEFSMVDINLCFHLLQATPNETKIVFIGDHNQLPSIGYGNLIRDFCNNGIIPTTILTDIVRQAGVLKKNCTDILKGKLSETTPENESTFHPWYVMDGFDDYVSILNRIKSFYINDFDKFGINIFDDVQLLMPMRRGELGVTEFNKALQRIFQSKLYSVDVPLEKAGMFFKGDKVIQRRNDYNVNIMNGTLGKIIDIKKNGDIEVLFEGEDTTTLLVKAQDQTKSLQLAYALTIHQCQGSEFPVSLVLVTKAHSYMLNRNLFYTGTTRSQKTTIIIGDRSAMNLALFKDDPNKRQTFTSLIKGKYYGV